LPTPGPTTVPSLALAKKLGALAPTARLRILPMGFEAPASGGPVDTERVDWLCMGRLVDIKGVDLALEAFARAELPADATLHVAGDGPRRAELERLASRLDAPVRFHGFVTGPTKRQLWQRCAGAIFCSKTLESGRHEGLPVSFLEASAHGVIPLCSPIPGLATYLADSTLQQIKSRAPHRWARGIEALAALSEERRVTLICDQQRATAELAWPRLIKRWNAELHRSRG
jgi:glycosyltransferase involved in cell wall biosynthesis